MIPTDQLQSHWTGVRKGFRLTAALKEATRLLKSHLDSKVDWLLKNILEFFDYRIQNKLQMMIGLNKYVRTGNKKWKCYDIVRLIFFL